MEEALILQKNVRGIKGPSPLINMPCFDIVWGFVPDYMHAVLLGVSRQHAALLLESADEPYYIGDPSTLRVLNERLQNIKPPHLITRLPRAISDFKFWKASEWPKEAGRDSNSTMRCLSSPFNRHTDVAMSLFFLAYSLHCKPVKPSKVTSASTGGPGSAPR